MHNVKRYCKACIMYVIIIDNVKYTCTNFSIKNKLVNMK
jgi:hypothetical protein